MTASTVLSPENIRSDLWKVHQVSVFLKDHFGFLRSKWSLTPDLARFVFGGKPSCGRSWGYGAMTPHGLRMCKTGRVCRVMKNNNKPTNSLNKAK